MLTSSIRYQRPHERSEWVRHSHRERTVPPSGSLGLYSASRGPVRASVIDSVPGRGVGNPNAVAVAPSRIR